MNGVERDPVEKDGDDVTAPGLEVAAALSDLRLCVERIQTLLPRVNAMIDRRAGVAVTVLRGRPRVIYGGGPSAFAPRGRRAGREAHPGRPVLARSVTPRSSRHILVATDLALAGYSRDEIGARLREWPGPGATHALDETFE